MEDKVHNIKIKYGPDLDLSVYKLFWVTSFLVIFIGGEPDIADLIWANLCESQNVYSCEINKADK